MKTNSIPWAWSISVGSNLVPLSLSVKTRKSKMAQNVSTFKSVDDIPGDRRKLYIMYYEPAIPADKLRK